MSGTLCRATLASAARQAIELSRTEHHKDERLKEPALFCEKVGPIQGLCRLAKTYFSFACSVLNMDGFKYWSNELFDGVEDLLNCFNGKVAGASIQRRPSSPNSLAADRANPNGPVARAFRSTMRVAHSDCLNQRRAASATYELVEFSNTRGLY